MCKKLWFRYLSCAFGGLVRVLAGVFVVEGFGESPGWRVCDGRFCGGFSVLYEHGRSFLAFSLAR